LGKRGSNFKGRLGKKRFKIQGKAWPKEGQYSREGLANAMLGKK
jgi:hypothetical protein